MARSFSETALVLRTRDIGEADRLCILLTREHGKIAARASGVRKLKSRKGSSMLPLQHIQVQLRMSASGYTAESAQCIDAYEHCRKDLLSYAAAQHAASLLLKLLEDHESVPEMYELTVSYLIACNHGAPDPSLQSVFTLRLLHLLGTLPSLTSSSMSHRQFTTEDVPAYSERMHGLCTIHEDPTARTLSSSLLSMLRDLPSLTFNHLPSLHDDDLADLKFLAHSILGSHVGVSPAGVTLPLALPGAIPI